MINFSATGLICKAFVGFSDKVFENLGDRQIQAKMYLVKTDLERIRK